MPRGKVNPDTGLTDKQERYCELRAYNPKKSISDCYKESYNAENMKPETINVKASELDSNGKISVRISQLRDAVAQEAKIDAAWVLRMAAEAFQTNSKLIHDRDGNEVMTNAAAAAKFLEQCGKHVEVQAFKDKVETTLSVSDELADLMKHISDGATG